MVKLLGAWFLGFLLFNGALGAEAMDADVPKKPPCSEGTGGEKQEDRDPAQDGDKGEGRKRDEGESKAKDKDKDKDKDKTKDKDRTKEEAKKEEEARIKALEAEAARLVKRLGESDAIKRKAVETRLAEIGGPAVDALVGALGHESWSVREAAQGVIRNVGSPAVPALKRALKKKDLEVTTRATALLKEIVGEGYLGIRLRWLQADEREVVPDGAGAVASSMVKDGPGAKAGVEVGDIIHKVDGKVVKDVAAVIETVKALVPGTKVKMVVYRAGRKQELDVLLGRRPREEDINKIERLDR